MIESRRESFLKMYKDHLNSKRYGPYAFMLLNLLFACSFEMDFTYKIVLFGILSSLTTFLSALHSIYHQKQLNNIVIEFTIYNEVKELKTLSKVTLRLRNLQGIVRGIHKVGDKEYECIILLHQEKSYPVILNFFTSEAKNELLNWMK